MPSKLKNNERFQGASSFRSKPQDFTPSRVFSVILDSSHPKYSGEDSIGTIFYGKVSENIPEEIDLNSLNRAKPLFSFIKYVPLLNEVVLILKTTSRNVYSDVGGDNIFISNYYLPNINIWNNPQQNSLPQENNLKNTPNANSAEEASLGIEQNQSEKNKIPLGEYFTEKDNIKSVQPFEGDMILEGRFGNSIRFGSSNPRGKNNWSENDSEGEPVTIISNGQPQVAGDTILEDINNIDSSIFMLSNQNINNFTPASLNIQSLGTKIAPTPNSQTLIVDTPPPPVVISLTPQVVESSDQTLEETVSPISPPTETQITSSVEIDDPIFALLDEAQDEGTLTFDQNIYNFSEYSPNNNFEAAALPEDLNEELYGDDAKINGLDYINELPLSVTPQKVRYTPVFIEPKRKWTRIPKTRLAQVINSLDISDSLKYSVMFVALKEQPDGSNIGGYNHNHYGIMADIGRWSFGSKIAGSTASTEGAGGQGIRTDKIRYFAAFTSTENGVDFMANTLGGKGFNSANANNIVDLYIDKWLSPSPEVAARVKANKRTTYSNLFNTAKNLIDAV